MEQSDIASCIARSEGRTWELFRQYGALILEENRKYNLTGFKDINLVYDELLAGSIAPLMGLHVPRGTLIADLGSGAGVPGIPLAIVHGHVHVTCFDSTGKKADFINAAAKVLGLENVSGICRRVEECGHDGAFRASFHGVVTRAMAHPYAVVELAAPLLAVNGFLYIYSDDAENKGIVDEHGRALGLVPAHAGERKDLGIASDGFLYIKSGMTPKKYPRPFAALKRDVERIRGA